MIRLSIRPLAMATSALALVAASMTLATPASASEPKAVAEKANTSSDITPMHWSCNRKPPENRDDRPGYVLHPAQYDSGSSTRCAELGWIYPYEKLDMFCWALDINGIDTWTYVISVPNPTKRGWINDKNLQGNGSNQECPNQTPPTG